MIVRSNLGWFLAAQYFINEATYLSPIENIWPIIKKKYVKDDHKLFSSWKPISGKNGISNPETNNPVVQTSSNEQEMLHHGKHAPAPTTRPVACSTFEINQFS